MKNPRQSAKDLAKLGRNGDTELLHVNPIELKLLDSFARANGTTMTTNPDTGKPEAFFFLPLIAPFLGSAMGLGTLGTAALSGGLTAAATGDVRKGLAAGLTGGALGALGNSLGQFGSQLPNAADAATQGAGAAEQAAKAAQGSAFDATAGNPSMWSPSAANIDKLPGVPDANPLDARLAAGTAATPAPQQMGMMDNLKAAWDNPEKFGNYMMQNGRTPLAMGLAGMTMGAFDDPAKAAKAKTADLSGLTYSTQRYTGRRQNPNGGSSENSWYASDTKHFAGGGAIDPMAQYGDGTQDNVPAQAGAQPVRLSGGEYVVPARAVSELGNGSTMAGVKSLDGMVNRLAGSPAKRAKNIPPAKRMPK